MLSEGMPTRRCWRKSDVQSWLEFWNGKHRIYVNERHLQAHYRRIAEDVLELLPHPAVDLLDWGCGPALGAPRLAERGVRVALYDKAAASQAGLYERFRNDARVRVLSDGAYAGLPDGSFDVVLVSSVVQYLSAEEFRALLPEFRRLLRPGGRLILADVIPPDARVWDDVLVLLRSGWRYGYFMAALTSLPHTFFSEYRRLRKQLGLTTYRPEAMLALLREFGFAARALPRNIGFSTHRLAFEAVKPAS